MVFRMAHIMIRTMRKFAALMLLAGCASAPSTRDSTAAKAFFGPHGFDLAALDRSADPCRDFYQFATGNWRKTHPLPAAFSRYGRFEELAQRNRATLRAVLEEAAPGTKIGDFYTSCMNEADIEAKGLAPIAGELARVEAIRTRQDVVEEIHRLQHRPIPAFGVEQRGGNPLFRFGAQNDFRDSDMVIAVLSQGGLGLPERDYYLRDDPSLRGVLEKYDHHLAAMFRLAGRSERDARADAARVIWLETRLARVSMPAADQRNPENVYDIRRVEELAVEQPMLDWPGFFRSIGLSTLETVNVAQPLFFREAHRLLAEAPLDTWKAYLRWNVIDAAAPALPRAFLEHDFAFRGRVLSGQQQLQPRWARCVRMADVAIGQLVGQEYVRRNFTPEAKRRVNELIDNLIAALRDRIPQLTWMGEATKAGALAKLEAFKRRIGYPDVWRDYTALQITPDSYARNLYAAREFTLRRNVSRIGKRDDPNEWGPFTPATVNASYNPARNFITFPAGILQPPFYDANADDAYNYGGIGMVIGHEMNHGFDDQGARFDAAGNLRNWWSEHDLRSFQERAECIAAQYEEFTVEPGLGIQGSLVLGEAIGDLGGLTLAFLAYQKSLEGKPRAMIDGFTPEQRFFLGFAQIWGENMAIEEQRRRAMSDPHAQGPFRVNGTVANMPEFARAWNCRMNETRCEIW
jgi:predicted metalloendopeptidase